MAAHDFYDPMPSNPYHYHDRTDAPLPPLPPARSHSTLPYEDTAYRYPRKPSQSYEGDYEDDNSIPLNGRNAKHESAATITPILPHEQEDPFVRDVDPTAVRKRRRKDQDGWFRGKITW